MSRPSVSLGFCDLHVGGRSFFTELLSPHFDITWDDPSEFVIYGHIGHSHRLQNGVKIYWTQELYGPNWNECDYAIIPKLVEDPRAYYLPIYGFDGRAQNLVREKVPDPVRYPRDQTTLLFPALCLRGPDYGKKDPIFSCFKPPPSSGFHGRGSQQHGNPNSQNLPLPK